MRYIFINRAASNPIANALVIVVGTIAIAASIVVGLFAAVVLGAALLILAAFVGIRMWWLQRKAPRGPGVPPQASPGHPGTSQTIEGEYHVVIEDKGDNPR